MVKLILLSNYYKKMMIPVNAVLSVSGDIDSDELANNIRDEIQTSNNLLKEVLQKMGLRFVITKEIKNASLIIGLNNY